MKTHLLPSHCHCLHPSTSQLIIVAWGKPGFVIMQDEAGKLLTGDRAVQLMNYHNNLKGLTPRQTELTTLASMFGGWDSEALLEAFSKE